MNRLKVIKTKKRKMTYQDLSWGVHPKMSGMQAQIELDNGFLVSVIYLDHEQLEHHEQLQQRFRALGRGANDTHSDNKRHTQ